MSCIFALVEINRFFSGFNTTIYKIINRRNSKIMGEFFNNLIFNLWRTVLPKGQESNIDRSGDRIGFVSLKDN